jgi:uncharacterized membrane protein YsdA (DUF1294 family)
MNLYGAGLVVFDKARALKRKRRIPEKALLWVGLIGGAGGEYLTMKIIHHKTRVKKFMAFLPVFIILHVIIIGVLVYFAFAK